MKLNCKPGELAIFVRSEAGNEGVIVRCIRILQWHEHQLTRDNTWLIDANVKCCDGLARPYAPDAFLRPIRNPGDDAIDESKTWLPPVPKQIKEPA